MDRVEAKSLASSGSNWMTQTRFGMFIHFGLHSSPAGVWQGEEIPARHEDGVPVEPLRRGTLGK